MKSCAILIDIWKESNISWIADIVNKINLMENIGTVILASYDVTDDEYYNQSTPWQITNEHKLARKFEKRNSLSHDYNQSTHPQLLKYKFINKEQYKCTQPFELVDLPQFETVYIFGQSYEDCVVNRPLGIKYWKNDVDTRVLALENSINHSNGSSVDFNPISYWKKIEDFEDPSVNCWELTKNL